MELMDDDDDGGGGDAAWMATFADLATLLLTFFVLMLSFANMDVIKFRMALGSVKDALGVEVEHPGDVSALATSPIEMSKRESTDKLELMEEIQLLNQVRDMIKQEGLDGEIEAELSERGVVVRVKGQVLFPLGKATLHKKASATLDTIIKLAKKMPYPMVVEGHTDSRPIRTAGFPSNWELSSARAIAAMRYIVAKGGLDPKRISVAGYAHMRPIASNKTAGGRTKNRRVEFVFLREKKRKSRKHKRKQPPPRTNGQPSGDPKSAKTAQTEAGGSNQTERSANGGTAVDVRGPRPSTPKAASPQPTTNSPVANPRDETATNGDQRDTATSSPATKPSENTQGASAPKEKIVPIPELLQ